MTLGGAVKVSREEEVVGEEEVVVSVSLRLWDQNKMSQKIRRRSKR